MWEEKAKKQLARLDAAARIAILDYLSRRILTAADPRLFGKGLTGELKGVWRYRVRDYRILCRIHDGQIVIYVVEVGHRKNIYH